MKGASQPMLPRKLMELLEPDAETYIIAQSRKVQSSYQAMKQALIDQYHTVMKDTDVH